MKKVVHYAVVLGLICVLAAFGLAATFRATKGPIAEKIRADQDKAQSSVLSVEKGSGAEYRVLNPDEGEVNQVVEARNAAGEVIGYAALGEAQGYGGKVRVIVGMDPSGEQILGVQVVVQNETPGLGTRIAEVKSDKTWLGLLTGKSGSGEPETTSEFLKQFRGRTSEQIHLGGEGDIQAITGATISSTAAADAVRDAVTKIRKAVQPGSTRPGADKADAVQRRFAEGWIILPFLPPAHENR